MAEFATSLIQSLGSAALREFARINGLKDEVERLKEHVETSRAVLLDLDEKQEQSNVEQNFVKRLKNVLIPADNLLDEFAIQEKINERGRNNLKKVLHPISLKNLDMAHEIEKIQKKFDDVEKYMFGLNLYPNVRVVEKTNSEWRETGSYVPESEIIGRDDDKENIVSLLRQPHGDPNVSFVAIVGMGGMGKTTLAQLVYSDEKVQNLFEKSMWVCVSENFDVKTIVKKMLESLTDDKPDDKLSLDSLQTMLHDNLTGKRYLLVLDDVWNESPEKWNKLRSNLMCGAQGSRVVVTTRSRIVAQRMDVKDPYDLSGLILEQSWSLLKKIAFGDDTIRVDPNIESIGKKIAEKCKGVPLAIRSLGSMLHSKREEEEWGHVLQADFWKLCEDEESILPILKLSYHNLSPQQRKCFAYCSLFPKDWEFEKDELIQMWLAHGLLDFSVEGKCMEDLGNQFVNIFLMKSFFQEAKFNEDDDIIGFKMHDLMHDLAKKVAGDDFCYLGNNAKGFQGRPMHVWVEFHAFYLLESLDASRLRTLIVFSLNRDDLLDGEKQSIISTFKCLRVLKICDVASFSLCVSIEKLNHLRFLSLPMSCELDSCYKSIRNLVCLQTIKVNLNEKLSTKVVSKLITLRHLEIRDWRSFKHTPVSIRKMSKQYESKIFPKWLSPLTNIIKISLAHRQGFQYLPPLERLPFLKSLELCEFDDLEYIYYEERNLHEPFFPSLKRLYIRDCCKLVGWKRLMRDGSNDVNTTSHHLLLPQFPCLSFLTISRCSMLTHMPTFPNIKSLGLLDWNEELLEATLNIAAPQYSIGCTPLSMLKTLRIMERRETTWGFKNVPQHWLQNLTSLQNLEFNGLSSQHCQAIEIWFKDGINYLPSLQKITFHLCKNLKALPDWICNISSLQHIKIGHCKELTWLPEEMPRLTNLHTLEIIECRLLLEECEKETSATRPRIAHIPNIII